MKREETNLMILVSRDHTSGGTSLQKEIRYYLNKEFDGCIINKQNLQKVIDNVNDRIDHLCSENKSWKREEFKDSGMTYSKDTWLRLGSSGVVLKAKPVKAILL